MKLTRILHRTYKLCISPLLGERCRFHPTCSSYCLQCIETHGLFRGTWLSFGRIARCNPLFQGGVDPVPPSRRNRPGEQRKRFESNISGTR